MKKAQFQSKVIGNDLVMSYPIIALGAPNSQESAVGSGEVCFYKYNEMKQQITKSTCLRGYETYEKFGQSVALSRSNPKRAVIGAPGARIDADTYSAGGAYIYEYNESLDEWELMEKILGKSKDERLGSLVSISDDGNFIAIGNSPHTTGISNRVRLYLYDDMLKRWVGFGGHFPSYALSSTDSYSANTLSDISVLALDSDDDDDVSLGRRYYVAFTSKNYIAGTDFSLARIYKYNYTLDEWDQITNDSDWFCYTSSGGGRLDFNFARNVLKLHPLGKSMNFVRGCAGTNNGAKPLITLGIYNATFNPIIDLPTTNSYSYTGNNAFNLFLSDDAKVLAVYRTGAVYAYEINQSTNEWVLSETITTSSKAMAFSEGVLVIGTTPNSISRGGDIYTIYQNANRKYTHHTTTSTEQQKGKQNRQHQQGRIGTNNEGYSTSSSSSFQRVLFGIFVIISLSFVTYQLITKNTSHSCGFCSRSNTAVNGGGGGVHRILVNARLHSRNNSSSSSRRMTTTDDHHFDGNNANGNPNEAGETISLNQELQNMNRSIV